MKEYRFKEYRTAMWMVGLTAVELVLLMLGFFMPCRWIVYSLAVVVGAAVFWLSCRQLAVFRQIRGSLRGQELFSRQSSMEQWAQTTEKELLRSEEEMQILRAELIQRQDTQSKFDALQAQINPHFLYNTLECIRGQAMITGDMSIVEMTGALSAIFQYSINRKGSIGTLNDELQNIRQYMQIQEFRFGDRIRMEIDAEGVKDPRRIYMPRMILQPLVENAIIHGLQDKEEGGTIRIHVSETDQSTLIDVIDDGVGMSPEMLRKLNEPGEADELTQTRRRIGVKNIAARLKLTYGRGCSLRVYSTPGAGTQILIVLPRNSVLEERMREEQNQ